MDKAAHIRYLGSPNEHYQETIRCGFQDQQPCRRELENSRRRLLVNGKVKGFSNTIVELKKIKVAQLLDPLCLQTGVEPKGGFRNQVHLFLALPDRPALYRCAPSKVAFYSFVITLGAIGTKRNLQSSFQDILAVRCVDGQGSRVANGGNSVDDL